jgi:biopolymer transport protein ExbD
MQLQTESKPYDTINVTPMLDLAYVLLVVFILMTTASVQGIAIALPKPSAKPPAEKHEVHVLKVDADGGLRLDGSPRTAEALRGELAAIKARDGGASVVLQGDGKTAYAGVVAMIDLVNEVGLGLSVATARIGF